MLLRYAPDESLTGIIQRNTKKSLSDQAWFRNNRNTNLCCDSIKKKKKQTERFSAQGLPSFTSYENRGKDQRGDLPLKPLILPAVQRLSCTASCSQGPGLCETIALWLSSQCNQQRVEYKGIKFQCFGLRSPNSVAVKEKEILSFTL